jgi:3-deoxy-alpha-D-manno-octulosonate 8-oxidase
MLNALLSGIKNNKNTRGYYFGAGSIGELQYIVAERSLNSSGNAIYIIDQFFEKNLEKLGKLPISKNDVMIFVNTEEEPTTHYINALMGRLLGDCAEEPFAIIGIGGGITMDVAKAISNLFTNGGHAEDYQGWDLVKVPGVYKIGIPTISGTGAESTRTCVMTHPPTGLKLGMNSDHTVFDQLILDPNLTKSVPRNQYFYTGMDAYIHCVEALDGHYRNALGDAFSDQTLKLVREVFFSNDIKSDESRAKLMTASYLGGCAVGMTYVGVLHPFSAGLSVTLGMHHGIANCIAMTAMEKFYPRAVEEFYQMMEKQNISIPRGVCQNLKGEQYDLLYQSTIVHEKPLVNALGDDFKSILTKDKVIEIFRSM